MTVLTLMIYSCSVLIQSWGEREKSKFLFPSVFFGLFVVVVLAVNLNTCYTGLET